MAEYNQNPNYTTAKDTQIPCLTNVNPQILAQNATIKVMQMTSAAAKLNPKNSLNPIRNQEIIIHQDPTKPSQRQSNLQQPFINQNLATNPQTQIIITTKKRKPLRFSEPIKYYSGNSYVYPYYYDSSGCYYCCWCNGNCFPCETCHQCLCSTILCDPFPCCNGCTGLHCGCLDFLPCCQVLQCVKQNNCQSCTCLPCFSGCQFCSQACDGTCISAIPCCNGCQCVELCQIIPCCNGCECEPLFGCLPCCNDAICNICSCLQGCQTCNCLQICGNGFQCLGNCDCGNCDCGNCDCNGCDCNGLDCNGCDLGGCDCDLGNCDC